MFTFIAILTGLAASFVIGLLASTVVIGYLRLFRTDLKTDLVELEARLHGSIGKVVADIKKTV